MQGNPGQKESPEQGPTAPRLLAPLDLGERVPWMLDRSGEPQWLTVIEVVSDTSYVVLYPNGTADTLTDS